MKFIFISIILIVNAYNILSQCDHPYVIRYKNGKIREECSKNQIGRGVGSLTVYKLVKYWPNGRIRSEENFKDNFRNGSAKVYSNEGRLVRDILFVNGVVANYRELKDGRVVTQISALGDTIIYKGKLININWNTYYELLPNGKILVMNKTGAIGLMLHLLPPDLITGLLAEFQKDFDAKLNGRNDPSKDMINCNGRISKFNDRNVDQKLQKSTSDRTANSARDRALYAEIINIGCSTGSLGGPGHSSYDEVVNNAKQKLAGFIEACKNAKAFDKKKMISNPGSSAVDVDQFDPMNFYNRATDRIKEVVQNEAELIASYGVIRGRSLLVDPPDDPDIATIPEGAPVDTDPTDLDDLYVDPPSKLEKSALLKIGGKIASGLKSIAKKAEPIAALVLAGDLFNEHESFQKYRDDQKQKDPDAGGGTIAGAVEYFSNFFETDPNESEPKNSSPPNSSSPGAGKPNPEGGDVCASMAFTLKMCNQQKWLAPKCITMARFLGGCKGDIRRVQVGPDGDIMSFGCPRNQSKETAAEIDCKKRGLVSMPNPLGGLNCGSKNSLNKAEIIWGNKNNPNVTDPPRSGNDFNNNSSVQMATIATMKSISNSPKNSMIVFIDPACNACNQFVRLLKDPAISRSLNTTELYFVNVNEEPELTMD